MINKVGYFNLSTSILNMNVEIKMMLYTKKQLSITSKSCLM